MIQICWAVDTCPFLQVFVRPVPVVLEVLHYCRSFQSSLGAFAVDILVHYSYLHYYCALPHVLYPPAQPLGLCSLAYHLEPYYYVLHPHMLHSCTLHSYGLYLLARSLAFDAHASALALGPSLGPQAHGLPPLASPLGSSLVLYPVVIRALVPDYYCLWVLKHLLEYYLLKLRLLNSSLLVLQVHFNCYLFLYTRALRKMAIQDLSVLLDLVFVNYLYLARLAPELSLTYLAYFSISLTSRSFALVSASIYFSSSLYSVSLRLIVGSGFGSNYWNRPDPTISTLGIDPKPKSIPIILESTRPDSSRYSISILGIESNCQGIENYVIMPRITNFRIYYY